MSYESDLNFYFFNSLTKRIDKLDIPKSKEIKMFTCGPSIYRKPHIGNYRTFIFEDILQRYLEYLGYKVTRLMNFTDIEDKAIEEAKVKGTTVKKLTKKIADIFHDEIKLLNIKTPTYIVRSTEAIEETINIIAKLVEKGYAYYYKEDIYFDPTKFKNFGKLYGLDMTKWPKKKIRFKRDNYSNNVWNLGDFILWHSCKDEAYPCWDAPIGRGWPAWNAQDPGIIMHSLGAKVDICCGGIDNRLMHHDYNIAIMESCSGEDFCPYWLHGHHLFVNGKKMSKRKNNILYVEDLIKNGYSIKEIRFFLIYSHYREKMNFTFYKFDRTSIKLDEFVRMINHIVTMKNIEYSSPTVSRLIDELSNAFEENMGNDLNVKKAFDNVYVIIKKLYAYKQKGTISDKDSELISNKMLKIDEVLQVIFTNQ
ncbi:MAG: class I tRNA ligase family protein [Candidatus Methanofastidiosum sp.]|nr:class I tRNA ligase family protein [Methanofastidiosum sp.]